MKCSSKGPYPARELWPRPSSHVTYGLSLEAFSIGGLKASAFWKSWSESEGVDRDSIPFANLQHGSASIQPCVF